MTDKIETIRNGLRAQIAYESRRCRKPTSELSQPESRSPTKVVAAVATGSALTPEQAETNYWQAVSQYKKTGKDIRPVWAAFDEWNKVTKAHKLNTDSAPNVA